MNDSSEPAGLAQQMQALVGASQMASILRDGEKLGTMARRYTNARLELADFVGANWPEICAILQRQDERVRELEAAWQPIETAPSGEDVLLCVPRYGVREELTPFREMAVGFRAENGSWYSDFSEKEEYQLHPPTHWMPLPPPPATLKDTSHE